MRSNARVLCENQPHPVQQEIGDTAVTAEASVDDARMENICSNSAGRVSARVELLREQHVGKLAVVIVPASKIVLMCECTSTAFKIRTQWGEMACLNGA